MPVPYERKKHQSILRMSYVKDGHYFFLGINYNDALFFLANRFSFFSSLA